MLEPQFGLRELGRAVSRILLQSLIETIIVDRDCGMRGEGGDQPFSVFAELVRLGMAEEQPAQHFT